MLARAGHLSVLAQLLANGSCLFHNLRRAMALAGSAGYRLSAHSSALAVEGVEAKPCAWALGTWVKTYLLVCVSSVLHSLLRDFTSKEVPKTF